MHTIHIDEYHFHFNSDYSGDLLVTSKELGEVKIPFEVVRRFIAENIRRQKIDRLENMSTEELLEF